MSFINWNLQRWKEYCIIGTVEKQDCKCLGCSISYIFLSLHYDIRDSNIYKRMLGPLYEWKTDAYVRVAHLAKLGVNGVRVGTLGLQKIKSSEKSLLYLFVKMWYARIQEKRIEITKNGGMYEKSTSKKISLPRFNWYSGSSGSDHRGICFS